MRNGGFVLATGTKEALAAALRKMMTVKPIDKVTVKDIVEICGVNRQTFYYHFDNVDNLLEWVFEQDSDRVFPREVVYNHWMEDMMGYFDYLTSNSAFTLNVYNSSSRPEMLQYLKGRMRSWTPPACTPIPASWTPTATSVWTATEGRRARPLTTTK